MKTFKYFDLNEFDSPDAVGSGAEFMSEDFLSKLNAARHEAGIPFTITSGYRTQEHNDSLEHSVPDSAHTKGLAADISVESSSDRYKIIKALINQKFNRIGIANGFIHVDDDKSKAQGVAWLY